MQEKKDEFLEYLENMLTMLDEDLEQTEREASFTGENPYIISQLDSLKDRQNMLWNIIKKYKGVPEAGETEELL